MKITVASGKGGTGKTFFSTNLAVVLKEMGHEVNYLDCDVEAPNGHLFIKPEEIWAEDIVYKSPQEVDGEKCTACGKCADFCQYNAIAVVKDKVLIFNELCHLCGGCILICPEDAIIEGDRTVGTLRHGKRRGIDIHYALLASGEGGMSPRLIQEVKKRAGHSINILDAPPGTACPAVETVKDCDLTVLVTDPTPFGIHDLKLAVKMCRFLGKEPVVLVNRAEYHDNALKEYCAKAELEIIGEIPDDENIAWTYSRGEIVVEEIPVYQRIFQDLAEKVINLAQNPIAVKKIPESQFPEHISEAKEAREKTAGRGYEESKRMKKFSELVVISGKGGTGKTSLLAGLISLADPAIVADCDVDASDLPLIFTPEVKVKGWFSGGSVATIRDDRCTGCGNCASQCRFHAIKEMEEGVFKVDPMECEGCGVCGLVCKHGAIELASAVNGQWYISSIRCGEMAHATLGIAEENSGRLVTLTRKNGEKLADRKGQDKVLIDGSPGTGCPVIASLTGAKYALVVTEPTVSGLHDLERIIDLTEFFQIPSGVLVNKCDINPEITRRIRQYLENGSGDFLGEFPYDRKVTQAQMEKKSIVEFAPDSQISSLLRDLWCQLEKKLR